MTLYALPRPYAGAALEPPEPRTIGHCANCGDGFLPDETVYRSNTDDRAVVHSQCCLEYLVNHEHIEVGPVIDLLSVWDWSDE